jgi:hypothetical protein
MLELTHADLQSYLAAYRRRVGELVIEELALGFWGGGGSIDVFTQRLSRSSPLPTCYEVKANRADFLADVRTRKHRRYEYYVERCYFAVPKGLVHKKEVPDGWGLIVLGPRDWYVVKGAPRIRMEDRAWRDLMTAVVCRMHPAPWRKDKAAND